VGDMGMTPGEQRGMAQSHVVPHFTNAAAWRHDELLIIDRGEGCYVWDTDENRYLDGLAGLFCTNIGHGRSDFAAVALKQMERLAFIPNWGMAHPSVIEAASMITSRAPGDLDHVFFVNSGSEAVESALKFARNYHLSQGQPERYKVIARELLWDGVRHVQNTCGDSVPEGTPASELASVKAIEEKILAEGPETVAMVIAEPVQNGRGAVVPPPGYWQELRKICDKYGILLCADEVINST